MQAQANAELGDVFVGLDLFETGVIVSPEMAAVIRNQLRDGELTVIDTRACALYEQMKKPLRNGILEELRQAMNNHYLAVRDEDRAADDCEQLYAELERICDQYENQFKEYDINQRELRSEVTRVGSGKQGRDFRDRIATIIPLRDRPRRK